MKVTALRLQSRNKSRVNVFLDGEFAFGLIKIEAIRLRIGQELSEADIERLKASDETETAYERILKFLATRPRSETEVRQRLRKQEVADPVQDAIVERLKRAGLLNDAEFAQTWVENRATFRPRSKRALQIELVKKGIPPEAREAALRETNDDEAAYQLASARAKRLTALPYADFRRKLSDYLARRGFGYDVTKAIVQRVWQETNGGPTTDNDD